MRENKGHGITAYTNDYCVVDLETTGIFVTSAKITEISAIKVRRGKVVAEFSTLINPGCHIPTSATAVNHITDEMVADAPTLERIIDDFLAFVSNDVIVGYNIASFDMLLLYDAVMDLRGIPFTNNYLDLILGARRCMDLPNHKLETVSKFYGLDTTGEHRALKDCYLTKECYDQLYADYDDAIFTKSSNHSGSGRYKIQYSAATLALQDLQTLLEEVIADGQVTFSEFSALITWMQNHRDLQGNYPFDRVFNALDRVLSDGKVTDEELEELQILFSEFVDPVKANKSDVPLFSLEGKSIVITGDFEYGSRKEVQNLISEYGGINASGVTQKTNIVVVGSKGSKDWKTGKYGSKIENAMKWIDKGVNIKIMEEKDFIHTIQQIQIPENTDTDATPWTDRVRQMLIDLIAELELPEGSLYLSDNYGTSANTKDRIVSYSVCIWEPDYPPLPNMKPGQNKIVLSIKPKNEHLELSIRADQEGDLRKCLPDDAALLKQSATEQKNDTVRVRFAETSPSLPWYIKQHTVYCYQGYISKARSFGCCHRFKECSDAKKCLHPNKLYATACMYRNHLDAGRIFYGKNKNVDMDISEESEDASKET